ncbi:MAG: hypothetical protein GY797_27925 [Deltaproteobacteria bacterium]|nr:hypothetical protein [Deltaproteobacteria bacterium]
MKGIAQTCLSCKFFRLTDSEYGLCREDKAIKPDYPSMIKTDRCDKWIDCGQQYFIRLGWIKAQDRSDEEQS